MSAAHFLKGRYEVIIFEKEGTPGGLIKCCRVNGNLFHTCGGHVFNSKRQDVLDWFDEEIDFKIVGSTEANSLEGKISNESPVGHALIGKKINDVVDVETQAGVIEYEVLKINRSV